MKKPPSKRKRFMKLARMTASVAGTYATTKVKTAFQSEENADSALAKMYAENGLRVVETLGELKGAAMKVGQMASMAGDFLPAELTEKLAALQKDTEPMSYDVIQAQIESEFGQPIETLYKSFSVEPFAAASIGQVHRAVTDDGEEVVVKVQYPGVDEACDSDIGHMRRLFALSGVALDKKVRDAMFDELARMLHEELDYCLEADNVRRFGEMHKDDPFVVVPRVVGERSSQRVLTLSYEAGSSIEVAAEWSKETRNLLGENLFKTFGAQMFRERWIHGDTHPGNFAFREDGTVVMYDFGCVKPIADHFADTYFAVLEDAMERRFDRTDQLMFDLGVRAEGSDEIGPEFYEMWHEVLLGEMLSNPMYDYSQSDHHIEIKKLVPKSSKYVLRFQPSAENALVERLVFGLHSMSRTLGPTIPWKALVESQMVLHQEFEK